ncbi:DUF4064 domain-containing protein [Candidatus Woesearchaeota archaeon]|nr:DUF4064 domain-containing protein [Candidatus Woesearchaeota archaeon]
MELNKVGSILALIAGILNTFGSLSILIFGLFIIIGVSQTSDAGKIAVAMFGYIFVILGAFELIMSILMIIGSVWMKQQQKCMKGSIMVIISSVFGGFNLLGIIGGILGIVYLNEQKQKKK